MRRRRRKKKKKKKPLNVDKDEIEDEVELIVQRNPVIEASVKQFFRPTQRNEARLMEKICQMVLRNVSDTKTYNSCRKFFRRFWLICNKDPSSWTM